MYRHADVRVFIILNSIANLFVVAAFLLIGSYHFQAPRIVYRDLCIMVMVLALFLKFHLMLLKVDILEKRIATLTLGTGSGSKILGATNPLSMIFFLTLFWITLVFLLLAFLPADILVQLAG